MSHAVRRAPSNRNPNHVAGDPDLSRTRFNSYSEGLNVPAGTLVSFAWRRHGKLLMLEVAEVDDDGCVSWEEHCTQASQKNRQNARQRVTSHHLSPQIPATTFAMP